MTASIVPWVPGVWADVEPGDYVLGRDGYAWLVTAYATVGDDTHVFMSRPGRDFDFERRPAQAVQSYRPPADPQAVQDAVNNLKSAGFDVAVIAP